MPNIFECRKKSEGDGAAAIVQSLTVTQQPTKTTYMEAEPLDLTGMRVSAVVQPFSGEVTGYVTTTPANEQPVPAGISDILVKYGNAITSVPITVYGIEEIVVTTQPTTTEYFVGDTLDLTGIVVTGYANNRAMSTDITELCTFSPSTLSTAGTQTVTVTYKNFTTTLSVGVYQPTLTVTTMPIKQKYVLNETLDLTGIEVTLLASGSNLTRDVTSQCIYNPVNGTVLNEAKTYTISVTYNGSNASFNVLCIALPVWDNRGLEYNSWDTIQEYTEFGKLGTVANVGDTKSFVMNNKTYNAEIVSINDGTGDAGQWYPDKTVDFICIELYETTYVFMEYEHQGSNRGPNAGGFPISDIKNTLENTLYPLLPSDLKNAIINKSHSYQSGYYQYSWHYPSSMTTVATKLWLPTYYEIYGTENSAAAGENSTNNKTYTLESIVKSLNGGSDNDWWLGTPYTGYNNGFWVVPVINDHKGGHALNPLGVPICFRIG